MQNLHFVLSAEDIYLRKINMKILKVITDEIPKNCASCMFCNREENDWYPHCQLKELMQLPLLGIILLPCPITGKKDLCSEVKDEQIWKRKNLDYVKYNRSKGRQN